MQIKVVSRGVLVGLFLLGLASRVVAQQQEAYVSQFFPGITGAGARAMGMGGAFIAIADDATAASWNPAGLAVLERPEVSLVGQPLSMATLLHPASTYVSHSVTRGTEEDTYASWNDPYAESPTSRSFDFASFTVPLRIGPVKLVPQISYQRVVDLGFGEAHTEQTRDQDHSSSSFATSGQESVTTTGSGGIDVWAASVGMSFTPKLYLGLALNRWGGSSTSSQALVSDWVYSSGGRGFYTIDSTRTQDFSGTSVLFGALVKPTPKINLGMVFRPGSQLTLSSTQQITTVLGTLGSIRGLVTRDGKLSWPRTVGAGVAVMPSDYLTLSADFTATNWSQTQFSFTQDSTIRTLDAQGQPLDSPSYTHAENQVLIWPASSDPQDQGHAGPQQVNASQVRLGVEYVVKNPRQLGLVVVPLRIGFIRDGQMTTSYPVSNVTYYGFTAGLGFVWKRVSLDFAWVHMTGSSTYGYDEQHADSTSTYERSHQDEGPTAFESNRVIVSTVVRF